MDEDQEDTAGVLITPNNDTGADPLETKLVIKSIGVTSGYKRYIRFSEPSKVKLWRPGWTVPITPPAGDIPVAAFGPSNTDVDFEVHKAGTWQPGDSVSVLLVVKDPQGQYITCSDSVRLVILRTDLDVDTDRDGNVEISADEEGEDAAVDYKAAKGALVLPNVDNDDDATDGDSKDSDCKDAEINGADDLTDFSELHVQRLGIDPLPANVTVKFDLAKPEGDTCDIEAKKRVRVFDKLAASGATAILGPTAGASFTFDSSNADHADFFTAIKGTGDAKVLGIEGIEPGTEIVITMTVKIDGDLICSDDVRLLVCPVLLIPNIQPISDNPSLARFYLSAWASDFIDDMGVALVDKAGIPGAAIDGIDPTGAGPLFAQDGCAFCFTRRICSDAAKEITFPVLLSLFDPPTGVRSVWPREYIAPDIGVYDVPISTAAGSVDMGGALECCPPTSQGGNEYQYGLVVVSSRTSDPFKEFFKRQKVQTKADGTLVVIPEIARAMSENVDEKICFVPANNTKGFAALVPTVKDAVDALRTVPPDTPWEGSFLWPADGSPDTYGKAVAWFDQEVEPGKTRWEAYEEEIAAVKAQLTAVGVPLVKVPALFRDRPPVNILPFFSKGLCNTQIAVIEGAGGATTTHLCVPKEKVPKLKQMYLDAVTGIGIAEENVHWIRSHELEQHCGAVHCGSNANRKALPKPEE